MVASLLNSLALIASISVFAPVVHAYPFLPDASVETLIALSLIHQLYSNYNFFILHFPLKGGDEVPRTGKKMH